MINRFAFIGSILLLGLLVLSTGYVIWGLPTHQPNNQSIEQAVNNGLDNKETEKQGSEKQSPKKKDPPPNIDTTKRDISDNDKQRYILLLKRHTLQHLAQLQQKALHLKDIETDILELEDNQQQTWWWLVEKNDYSLQQAQRQAYYLKMYHDLTIQIKKKPTLPPT